MNKSGLDKKMLLKWRTVKATPEIMELALKDELIRNIWGYDEYKREVYMRCRVQYGILRVVFFLAEHLRMGADKPVFEIFVRRGRHQFITYDYLHHKWLTGKLDRLPWSSVFRGGKKVWISDSDSDVIKNYLREQVGGFLGLLRYQQKIRADELQQRYDAETSSWDRDLKQIPALPKDWMRWVCKVGIPENYIYYEYRKKGAESGYCTYCEKEVPIKKPRNNKEGICPCCRRKIIFKSIRKAGFVHTQTYIMYLIQRCKDGFVVRYFQGLRKYPKGRHQAPECVCFEIERTIYDTNAKMLKAYQWGNYRQREFRWIPARPDSWYSIYQGQVYGKTLPSLKKGALKKTGLIEYWNLNRFIDPKHYLTVLQSNPQLEQIVKAGLLHLTQDCLNDHDFAHKSNIIPEASSLTKYLRIDLQELKRLRRNDGGCSFLKWLQYEKKTGKRIEDEQIRWFLSEAIEPEDIQFISHNMSIVQIKYYLNKQICDSMPCTKSVLSTWSDYISMAKRLKMNTNDAIIFRVKKLQQRHDELVKQFNDKEIPIKAAEIAEKYPHVEEKFTCLKEKYEYSNVQFSVIAPTCIEDIILEGKALSHCVASSEHYWERIERNESYILFLRRTDDIDRPYYTLEVEPNGTVRQKRTEFDRQKKDIEQVKEFLLEWQTVIRKRLTKADLQMAKKSKVLRNQNFTKLRENKVTIAIGDLGGKPLVDVLLEDLMEAA